MGSLLATTNLSRSLGARMGVSGGGGGGAPDLTDGAWVTYYSATAATVAADGATATGVPYGLAAVVSGGVLTVSGVPL